MEPILHRCSFRISAASVSHSPTRPSLVPYTGDPRPPAARKPPEAAGSEAQPNEETPLGFRLAEGEGSAGVDARGAQALAVKPSIGNSHEHHQRLL